MADSDMSFEDKLRSLVYADTQGGDVKLSRLAPAGTTP